MDTAQPSLIKWSSLIVPWCLTVVSCSGGQDRIRPLGNPATPFPSECVEVPFLFIYVAPGHSSSPLGGVLVAIWPDGRIVRASTEASIGKSYIKSRLDKAQLADIRRSLNDCGLLVLPEGGNLLFDMKSERVTVRWGRETRTWLHNPGFENTPDAPATNPSIARLKTRLLEIKLRDAAQDDPRQWSEYPHAWYK